MFDVIGVGANSVDYVYVLPQFPSPDSAAAKLRIAHYTTSCGGQTATTLCTCAAMGLGNQELEIQSPTDGTYNIDAVNSLLFRYYDDTQTETADYTVAIGKILGRGRCFQGKLRHEGTAGSQDLIHPVER